MPPASLFHRLKTASAAEWAAYTQHPFVAGMADGTLPEACFRHYLAQDYLFLIHFARAYALAAYKGETLADIRQAAAGLSAIIDVEMALHIKYCASWNVSAAELESVPEAEETMAYTRYVLERGLAGDLLDLHVALAPCIVGYGEIGAQLAADPKTKRDGNPYLAWIEMYASAEYQTLVASEIATLDALMARRGGEGRLPSLIATFGQATRLEAAFWQMGLKAQAAKPA